jgi:hypothetical protein
VFLVFIWTYVENVSLSMKYNGIGLTGLIFYFTAEKKNIRNGFKMCAVAVWMWMWMLPICTTTKIKYEIGAHYGVPNQYDCMALRHFMSKKQMNR